MSIKSSKNFDESVIKKAKEYVENEGSEVLRGTIEAYEIEKSYEYKSQLYEIIEEILQDIEESEKRISQYRASKELPCI